MHNLSLYLCALSHFLAVGSCGSKTTKKGFIAFTTSDIIKSYSLKLNAVGWERVHRCESNRGLHS